jgi:predicted Rossmann fold nucleotide-binding protein DprA/Smf involved in DNA uptake
MRDRAVTEAEPRKALMRALQRDPYDVWTPQSLAGAVGLSLGQTLKVLAELVAAGLVLRLPGPDEEYTIAGADY